MEFQTELGICLFADGTKIWWSMRSEVDCTVLQNGIKVFNRWCQFNKMKIHPEKCAVISIFSNIKDLLYLNSLPMSQYRYNLGNNKFNHEEYEKDLLLGIIVNSNFSWLDHQSLVTSKASRMLGLTKRTCHFLVNSNRKRTVYLTLVRSQFEHCSAIWCPTKLTQLQKFEAIQKNAIKWILDEEFLSYSDDETYLRKCKQVNILPISKIFELLDLVLFHKIVNGYISFNLLDYVKKCNGASRLKNNHLDSEC